jgi:hypothetical protein
MPKARHVPVQIPESDGTQNFNSHALVPLVLFSGIGVSLCLIAVFMGLRGTWFWRAALRHSPSSRLCSGKSAKQSFIASPGDDEEKSGVNESKGMPGTSPAATSRALRAFCAHEHGGSRFYQAMTRLIRWGDAERSWHRYVDRSAKRTGAAAEWKKRDFEAFGEAAIWTSSPSRVVHFAAHTTTTRNGLSQKRHQEHRACPR